MPIEPAYKKRFLDWFFNAGAIYSQSGNTNDISLGITHGNPYLIENELTNPANNNRTSWFKGWYPEYTTEIRRWNLTLAGTRQVTYNTNTNTLTALSPGFVPPTDGYYSYLAAGSTDPVVYAGPSHAVLYRTRFHPSTQSDYSDQIFAVYEFPTVSPWYYNGYYFDTNIPVTYDGDLIDPTLTMTWGA
jgi:hypothetical protein